MMAMKKRGCEHQHAEVRECAPVFENTYTCDRCGHEWKDEWSAKVDEDCPNCNRRHISPRMSTEVAECACRALR